MQLALKIDVDTYQGIRDGAARLASYLQSEKIPASFFVSLGPDNSGWAAVRVFRHPGFLKKMQRTSAVSLYGLRTVLSGTLWPARPMGTSFAAELRRWRDLGFEVSPHGYDHILWHDRAAAWDPSRAAEELAKTVDVYRHIFGENPRSFAAPGWQAGPGTWQAMESLDLLYHSDTRGEAPYYPAVNGKTLPTLEIPTTLPTWDEMLAWDGVTADSLPDRTWSLLSGDRLNVWTIHAEFEGTAYFPQFKAFIDRAQREEKIHWVSLRAHAQAIEKDFEHVPARTIEQGSRPGRAGTVTCQHG